MRNFFFLFQGYSFVAPSVLFSRNVISDDIVAQTHRQQQTIGQPHESRPSIANVLSPALQDSGFFRQYELEVDDGPLGDGSYSVCCACRSRSSGQRFAVKIVSRRVDCSREIRALRACQGHPNIVQLVGVHQDAAHTYLVTEILEGGEIGKLRNVSERRAQQFARQIASALR